MNWCYKMTNNIANQVQREVQSSSLDLLSPLASRALFWRARYMAESPVLPHLPLLFWVVESLRPNVAITLGVSDAVPHFATCQAVEKLGLDGLCYGIDVSEEEAKTDLSGVLKFNDDNFCDFSHIMRRQTDEGAEFLHGGKIDLLVVNQEVSQALFDWLDNVWLPNLSDRGVILFLRGGSTTGYDSYIHRLAQDENLFILDAETRACLILRGCEPPERLQRLARFKIGEPGYLSARTVFSRLGELHAKSHLLEKRQREAQTARTQRDAKTTELAETKNLLSDRNEQLTTTQDQLKERSSLVATAQAESFDLRQENEALTKQVRELRQKTVQAETERDDLKASLNNTQTKAKTLQAELDETKTAAEALQAEASTARDQAARAEAERDTLKGTLNSAQTKAEALQTELDETKAAAEALAAEHDDLKATLADRLQDISTLGSEIERLQKAEQKTQLLGTELSELETRFNAAETDRKRLDLLVSKQEEDLSERYTDIAALGLEIQRKDKEIGALKTRLGKAETVENERHRLQSLATQQEEELGTRLTEIKDLRLRLAEVEEVRQQREDALGARETEIEDLKRRLAETEEARNVYAERVGALEHSTSWRVTAPLRKVSLNLKRP